MTDKLTFFFAGVYTRRQQRLKQVTDADLEHQRVPNFNDESVLNYVFASWWPQNISYKLLSPRYVGPDLLRRPPYINCGAQIPHSELRIMHLEKCLEVKHASWLPPSNLSHARLPSHLTLVERRGLYSAAVGQRSHGTIVPCSRPVPLCSGERQSHAEAKA